MTEEAKNSEAVQEVLPLVDNREVKIEAKIEEASMEEMPTEANPEPAENMSESVEAMEEMTEAKEEIKIHAAEPIAGITDKIKSSTVVGISAILIVIIGVIYFAAKQATAPTTTNNDQTVVVSDQPEAGKISIIEEATADDIGVLVNSGKTVWPKTEIFAFMGNSEKASDPNDCAQVFALKRSVDKKYDSNLMNTVSGLLQPVTTAEKEAGYFSALPSGTTLKYLKLDDTGVIEANFSGNIANAAGSCAVTAIRAQIRSTLLQFSNVKSVTICVDGECDDSKILQP